MRSRSRPFDTTHGSRDVIWLAMNERSESNGAPGRTRTFAHGS